MTFDSDRTASHDGDGHIAWKLIEVAGAKPLPPDPRVMDALGLNHALETALADLVDNSIDAGADTVLIRFVRRGYQLLGLYVIDNGHGMDEATIDIAMTPGGSREYGENALGHFGVGLNAASLGQAASFTVVSRSAHSGAVGRRSTATAASKGFVCEILSCNSAEAIMSHDWGALQTRTGTIVRWDDVKCFPGSRDPDLVERFLETTLVRVRHHLGLVFHRFIERRDVQLMVDTFDLEVNAAGPPFIVESLDPFGYLKSGRPGYPRTLAVKVDEGELTLTCHIWPGRSQLANFNLPGRTPMSSQGLYFYRHDRLLQVGGWNSTSTSERDTQLARVAIDIPDHMLGLFRMNPEKTRVETGPVFSAAVDATASLEGTADGSWHQFLADARETFKVSRKRKRERAKVVPPGRGFAPRVRKAVERELDFLPGEEQIEIRWVDFDGDAFFEVDRDSQSIWLNKAYRAAVIGDRNAGLNDAPLVKTLLYLLAENLFHGAFLGAKDRDNIELWSAILGAAAKAELE